jgi:hypothetical protein
LRKEEYDLLENYFGVPGDDLRVNYRDLVEDVDTVFTIKVKINIIINIGIGKRSQHETRRVQNSRLS